MAFKLIGYNNWFGWLISFAWLKNKLVWS